MFGKKQHVDVKKSAQKVLEAKRDSLSRLKHLRVFLDNVDNPEAKLFFESNYSHIYCIFHDVFSTLETSLKQRVHKTQKEELDNVKYIFEKILVLLPELLAQRWQWHSVRIIIKKMLHPLNSTRLRLEGVRLFILWYQILGESAPSEVHNMFLQLVPGLLPGSPPAIGPQHVGRGTSDPTQDSTFYTSVEADSGPVVAVEIGPLLPPQGSEVQTENITVTYLGYLMEFMVTQVIKVQWREKQEANHRRCFEFLFEKFKRHYLPHIFPDFCYTNSIYKPNLGREGYEWVLTSLELPSLRKDRKTQSNDSTTIASTVAAQCRSVTVQWVVSYTQSIRVKKEDINSASRKQEVAEAGDRQQSSAHELHSSGPSLSSVTASSAALSIGTLSERESDTQLLSAEACTKQQLQVVRDVLYSRKDNVDLIHEIFRQAFLLPFTQSSTTKNVINTYRDWIQKSSPDVPPFLVDVESKEQKEDDTKGAKNSHFENASHPGALLQKRENVYAGSQNVFQIFITNAANVFLLEIAPENRNLLDEQVELCKRVMNIYRYMVMKQHMEKNTWEQLLLVLLRVTSLVLKTSPPTRKDEVLGGRLAPALFQTLIVTWIKANLHATISLELWDGFLNVLSSLTQWEELIREWAKTMETLTRILAQHVYRLNLGDLPLQREQQHRRRRGLKQHPRAADASRGNVAGTSSSSTNRNAASRTTSSHTSSLAGSREEERGGSQEGGNVPPSPRLRSGSLGQRSNRTEDDDRSSEQARCSSGDGSLPPHHAEMFSEKHPPVTRCYSDGHLLLHKVERLRRMRRAGTPVCTQDRFDIASVSSDTNGQHDVRPSCPITKSRSLDYLTIRVDSPCMSHGSEYRSRSPSPTPSSGLESTSIKDSPIQIDVLVASSEGTCNSGADGGTDRHSVLAGGTVKGWLPEVAVAIWRRMLGSMGDVNNIHSPAIHAQVMEHLIALSETLVKMRENLGVTEDNMTTPDPPALIPPLLLIAPWLFEATSLADSYERGRLLALRLLCWLTVRRHDYPLSFDYLARFYKIVHSFLLTEDQKAVNAIVKYCGSKLFSCGLPGHTILFLDLIRGAGTVVCSAGMKGMPRVEAVTLLGSLLCFPNVYKEVKVLQPDAENLTLLPFTEAKEHVATLLLRAGMSDPDCAARCVAISSLAIMVYEELAHNTGFHKIPEAVGVLLISIKHTSHKVAQVASDMLRLLCDHAAYLSDNMSDIPVIIIEVVSSTLYSLLPSNSGDVKEDNRKVVLSLLFCLADWVMNLSLDMLTKPNSNGTTPLLSVLNVLDHALMGNGADVYCDVSSLLSELCPLGIVGMEPEPEKLADDVKSQGSSTMTSGGRIARSMASFVPPAVLQNDLRRTGNVKLAARMVLCHLLHQLGHFPMGGLGAAQLTSLVAEHDDVPMLHDRELCKEIFTSPNIQMFVLNNSAIMSLVEVPSQEAPGGGTTVGLATGKSQVRIIVRDLSGRFAWDCLTLYGPNGCRAGSFPPGPVPDPCLHYTTQRSSGGRNMPSDRRDRSSPPRASPSHDSSGRRSPVHRPPDLLPLLENTQENYDNLDDLLQYVGHTSPECVLSPSQPLNSAAKAAHELASLHEADTIQLLMQQQSQELSHTERSAYSSEMLSKTTTPPNTTDPLSPFQYSRLLLENFNFFTWEKRPKFDLVKKNEKLLRELRNLDSQACRETHKIAVIYVAEGQEDKNSIFMNQSASPAFEQFVAGLGWEVDLETHTGYNGGLETNRSTGKTAPYYAASFLEVLFHVSTRIPALEKDAVTKKLRHLGNDEVHIVWSEHTRDYRRGIIPTEFCDVLIVIYPLGNWLYRIQINPKPEVPFFGPLFDGAIVDHKVLPALVRATAINAGRAVNSLKPAFRTYYEHRAQALENIVQNYKEQTTFEDFASKVLAPAPAKSPLVLRRSGPPGGSDGGSPQMGSTLAAALLDCDSGPSTVHHRTRPVTMSASVGEQASFPQRSVLGTPPLKERPLSASRSQTTTTSSIPH
ncbi:ral GTPase-activating protein subunit alpha-1-like isoform X3 [Ornithodoros turicata]|uniref:ral GTPase-activating protein subunit alpha-1-like isoform X3 n=1 Tax=Ornithodoros turicata TaxID=34597 RepID=UPI00313A4091